jgi:hypothetical protein
LLVLVLVLLVLLVLVLLLLLLLAWQRKGGRATPRGAGAGKRKAALFFFSTPCSYGICRCCRRCQGANCVIFI